LCVAEIDENLRLQAKSLGSRVGTRLSERARMAPVGEVIRPRVSYADLVQHPEDGRRYEIYDGEVFVVPSPLPLHQIVADNLYLLLRDYATAHGGIAITAPLDIVFSDYDVLQPDIVFFSAARRHLVKLDAVIRHAPDLVVEVLSPSTESTDRGKKLQTFARFGVPEYWIVDPRESRVEVLRLTGGVYALHCEATSNEVATSAGLRDLAVPLTRIIPEG
jgi:Uma2 family endonuclease